MKTKCKFCRINQGIWDQGVIDKPIFENEDFFVISSIGSLVTGWLLLVPKKHQYNMAEYYADKDFIDFLHKVVKELKHKIGEEYEIMIFEHGANHCGSKTGCGTDHAHLHIVPYQKSLLSKIYEDRKWTLCKLEEIRKFVGNKEYLAYTDLTNDLNNFSVYINLVDYPESQYFRRLIAEDIGVKEKFNYREFPNEEISESTCRLFGRGK